MPIKIVAKDSPEYAEMQQMRAKRQENAKKEAGKRTPKMKKMPYKKKTPASPKSKKKAFEDFKKKYGYHSKADPAHPMNSERTGPSTMRRYKKKD